MVWFCAHSCRLRKPGSGHCYLRVSHFPLKWSITSAFSCKQYRRFAWRLNCDNRYSRAVIIPTSLSGPVFHEYELIIFCVRSKTFFRQIMWWNSGANLCAFRAHMRHNQYSALSYKALVGSDLLRCRVKFQFIRFCFWHINIHNFDYPDTR